jgi:microcystin-dependent protein
MFSFLWSVLSGDTYTGAKAPYLLSDIDTFILLQYAEFIQQNPQNFFEDYEGNETDIQDYLEQLVYSLTGKEDLDMPIVGEIKALAHAGLPDKYLYCNGDEVLKATYPLLFDAIGSNWGTPTLGSDYFVLPDFRDKFLLGFMHGGGSPVFASSGGEKTVTLVESQIPAHNHVWLDTGTGASTETLFSNGTGFAGGNGTPSQWKTHNTGGGQAHNNMPPYIAINYVIYAGQ